MGDTDWKWLERHKKQQGGTSMSLPVLLYNDVSYSQRFVVD